MLIKGQTFVVAGDLKLHEVQQVVDGLVVDGFLLASAKTPID